MILCLPTKVYFGREYSTAFLDVFKAHRIAVITNVGKRRLADPYIADFLELISELGIDFRVIDCARPNPTYESVQEAVKGIRLHRCTAVLAIGGGSCIDCAKAAAYQAANDMDLWHYVIHPDECTDKALLLGVISTTAGTGSEINCCAVITRGQEKRALCCPALFPKAVLINPDIMRSIPKTTSIYQTLDSLYHAIEGFFSKNSTLFSQMLSISCVRLCLESIDGLITNPSDLHIREALCTASLFSGLSDMYGGCLSAHSLGHAITAFHPEISHGMSITLIARSYYSKMLDTQDEIIVKKKKTMFSLFKEYIPACSELETEDFGQLLDRFFSYLQLDDLHLATHNISPSDLKKLYRNAKETTGELFENDPLNLSDDIFEEILYNSI